MAVNVFAVNFSLPLPPLYSSVVSKCTIHAIESKKCLIQSKQCVIPTLRAFLGFHDGASQGRHTHDEQQTAAHATGQSSHMIDYVAMLVVYRRVFHAFEQRM